MSITSEPVGYKYEIPTLKYPELPLCVDDQSLATTLGIKLQTLWYLIIKKQENYRVFKIPKRRKGEFRIIEDPQPKLKWTQRRLLERFLEKIPVGEHIGAFTSGRSCADTAQKHTNKAVVICLDIKDFFPSIRRAMIRNYFNNAIGYNFTVSSLLADLMTNSKRCVPQGAPTSGAISNLIADWLFDQKIIELLKQHSPQWEYSRYADDLIMSHPEKQPKEELQKIIDDIAAILQRAGFRLNWKKKKIRGRGMSQRVLGCVVNNKVNIPRQDYMELRAILHNVCVNGWETEEIKFKEKTGKDVSLFAYLRGQLSYIKQVNLEKYHKLKTLWDHAQAIKEGAK